MQRDEILKQLREMRPDFPAMNIKKLALFGSIARDEAGQDSDIDILIEFDRPAGLVALSRKKRQFEALLGHPVDVYPMQAVLSDKSAAAAKDVIHV